MAKKKIFNPLGVNRKIIDEYIIYRTAQNKSNNTLYVMKYTTEKLAHFLKKKEFKDATEKDLQGFMGTINFGSYNVVGISIIQFYRWLLKLDKDKKPDNLKWLEFKSKKDKIRHSDPEELKKYLITPQEYDIMLKSCENDRFGMWEALFETYWLSGGRLNEVRNMKIKDVIKVNGGNNIKVALKESKTVPRVVPLCEYPEHLMRWVGNHPQRENPETNLWISIGYTNFGKLISKNTIQQKLHRIRASSEIKDTISIHCFRKTRATIMINKKGKDGGKIYTPKELGLFFGWTLQTVIQRMEEYDLSGQEELEATVFGQVPIKPVEDFDTLKNQKERLEDQYQKKIAEMEKQMASMEETIRASVIAEIKDMVKGYTQ